MTKLGDDPQIAKLISLTQRTLRELASQKPDLQLSAVGWVMLDRAGEACVVTLLLAARMTLGPLSQEHADIFANEAGIARDWLASLGIENPYLPQ